MKQEQSAAATALQAALRRHAERPSEFDPARAIRLPDDKRDFPKLLLLDTLHWVELAKAELGKPSRESTTEALSAIRTAVERGRVVLACTDTNLDDIGRREREVSRIECAKFLVELSQNYPLTPHLQVREQETRNAVLGRPASLDVRSNLLQWGIGHAWGAKPVRTSEPKMDRLVNLILSYPELSVFNISEVYPRDEMRVLRNEADVTLEAMRAVRKLDQELSYHDRLDAELRVSFGERYLEPLLEAMGQKPNALADRLSSKKARREFWLSIPTVDSFMKIVLQRDKNTDAKTNLNDVNDLGFLQVAIPYANIVATEKLWTNIVRQTDLPMRYDCSVIAEPAELLEALRSQNCL